MSIFDFILGTGRYAAQETLVASPAVGIATVQTTQEVIEQIHREFNSVGEMLLSEAQATLAGTDPASIAKGERLKAAGFVGTRQVKQTQAQAEKAAVAKAQQELIMHYALRYPTSKFITRQHVDQIAAKYNLVVGDTSAYAGFVPDKNLKELEAFNQRFQAEDKPENYFKVQRTDGSWRKEAWDAQEKKYPGLVFPMSMLDGIKDKDGVVYSCEYIKGSNLYISGKITIIDTFAQLICAPIADMNLSGLSKLNGQWFSAKTKHIPDPVVLQPVKGGYLIVTAWGDEASDPLVLNEQLN